jgi:hypothetical protein
MRVRRGAQRPALTPATDAAAPAVEARQDESSAPSTSAAPLPSDVAQNLQLDRGGDGQKSVHARIAQLGAASKEQAQRFLADVRVQQIGTGLKEEAREVIDFFAGQGDQWLSTVGEAADTLAAKLEASSANLEALADEGRAKLQSVVDQLRERAACMAKESERMRADAATRPDGERAWATSEVLGAVAGEIERMIRADSMKEFLALGGRALFKITSDVLELAGEIAHAGAKGLAAGISVCGRFVKWLLGTDTLRSTGITVFGGVRVNCVSQKMNAGVGGGMYFPTFKAREQAGAESYFDMVAFDWGYSAASPVAGAGWNSRGGAGAGINLYFVSATFNDMTERVFIGIPGVWGVTLGRDKERGSEINFGNFFGLAGGEQLGAYASYGISLHTPLLDPVNKYVTRPIAMVIVGLSNAVARGAKAIWKKM